MENNQAPTDGIHKLPGVNEPPNPLGPIAGQQLPPGYGYPSGPNANPYPPSGFGPSFPGGYGPPQNAPTPQYGYGAPSQGNFPPLPSYGPQQVPQGWLLMQLRAVYCNLQRFHLVLVSKTNNL